MQKHADHKAGNQQHSDTGHYAGLGIEMAAHFVIMYLVMYSMIATLAHFYLNINNVWMTLMMVTPMAPIMLVSMRSMYPSQSLNIAIIAVAIVVFVGSFFAMRTQAGVGDKQFLKSMIPHHSGAVLMCEQATLTDPEIVGLCKQIVAGQKREIEQMQVILKRY